LYESYKLFIDKNWFKVIKVGHDVTNILCFRVDIPLFSSSIWFSTKMSRAKPNNKIGLEEVFGLPCLSTD